MSEFLFTSLIVLQVKSLFFAKKSPNTKAPRNNKRHKEGLK
jgi:hypothetical protein